MSHSIDVLYCGTVECNDRDLLDKVMTVGFGRPATEEKMAAEMEVVEMGNGNGNGFEDVKVHAPPRNVISIHDIEITDEFSLQILTGNELRQIIARCPARTHIWKWKLFYSTAIHGISMNTLYSNCENVEESILIIHSSTNDRFGAFVDCTWTVCAEYRGSVDCFVFQFVNRCDADTEPDDDGDSEQNGKLQSPHKLKVFKASGKVPYFMRNDMESVTIGAGACSAIYFDADLNFGRSTECSTYDSPRLSQDSPFQITTLEIWAPSL